MARLIDAARTARPDRLAETVHRVRSHYRATGDAPPPEAQAAVVGDYYDLVTDFYEYGWGQSFHFAVRTAGDSLAAAIERHEAWLGEAVGLAPGVTALDLGCGVGGPMRYLARTTGAHVTGVNVNRGQLERARARAAAAGLADRVAVVEADFAALPFADATFDAVYAIEATCHAADRRAVFAEAWRVLRPGGRFAGYEWCTTASFDAARADHRQIAHAIQEGNALPPLLSTSEIDGALLAAGFVGVEARDVAGDCDPSTPWWMALNGEGGWRALPRTPWGRAWTTALVRALERVGLAPRGASAVSDLLNSAADALVAGGRAGVFTPMYRWQAEKP